VVTPEPALPPIQVIQPIPFVPSADYLGTVGSQATALALRGIASAPMRGFEQVAARLFSPGGEDDLNFVFFTPAGLSYRARAVEAFHGTFLALALGSTSSLLLLVGAANLALRRRWELPVDEPGSLLLRVLVAGVAALVSLEVLGLCIELNNALVRTLLAVPLCDTGVTCRPHLFGTLGAIFGRLTASTLLDLDLTEVLATLALGIVLLILVVQHAVRIGFLAVLLAFAPLVVMLWVLSQTRWLARMWASAFFSTLLAQPLQVLGYLLAAGLLALATPPGQTAPGGTIVSVLIGLAALGVSLSLPRLLRAGVSALEAPVRTATKALMLWNLAARLGGSDEPGDPWPARRAYRRMSDLGEAGAPAAAAMRGARPSPGPGFGLGLGGMPTTAAALGGPGAGGHRDQGSAPPTAPTGEAAHDLAALLHDPAATFYGGDQANRSRPRLFDPARGFPATVDPNSVVVTFADRRPDRHLSAAEVGALAAFAQAAPVVQGPFTDRSYAVD
jgi:hypothetical protein